VIDVRPIGLVKCKSTLKPSGAKLLFMSPSGSHKIPWILQNPYFHQPLVSIMNQNNQILHLPSHFFQIHCNVILPFMTVSFRLSLFLKFPHQKPLCTRISRLLHLRMPSSFPAGLILYTCYKQATIHQSF